MFPIFQNNALVNPPDTLLELPADIALVKLPGLCYGELPDDVPLPVGWSVQSMRQVIAFCDDYTLSAYHVMQWRRQSQFCGYCASRNEDSPDEIARLCPCCKRREYPRISPAVIVRITNNADQILLAHNTAFSAGLYSLIAGFVSPGENLERAVMREIQEEINITVNTIRYYASQPWPFPNSLMIGFTARYDSGMIKPDGIEIADARWFSRGALPVLPGPGSLSRRLIDSW
ncbi:MAG: NAD(+) diphosphatase [Spirochaetaceae bacterium]|jgi:NAD+ diphosphatase|nr:NAD(+) diphosphatase [Spirochaetaceae bacterium]